MNMIKLFHRKSMFGVMSLIVALAGILVVPAPASASATGCAWYGAGLKYGVRNGSFCASVNGYGTYIQNVTGNFGTTITGLNQVCNPSIKLDVFDRWDHWIASRQGSQKSGCYPWAVNYVNTIPVNWDFPQADGGRVYVTLQSSGSSVAVNSFYFHK